MLIDRLKHTEEVGVFLGLIVLVGLFGFLNPEFLSLRTWGSILTFASVLGVISLGSCLLMTAGEFDLSVGSVAAFSGMIFSMGIVKYGFNSYACAAAALTLGTLLGYANGLVVLKTKIPSFIVTLGTMLIWRGVVLAVSGGFPVSLVDERSGVVLWFGKSLGNGFYSATLWWIGLALVFSWALKHSALGNRLMAVGGNAPAAFARGVSVKRIKLMAFSLSGFLAALAGMILFAELQDLSPTAGESYELYAIAAAVIGGTALTGGVGSVIGTVLGTLLMGVIQSGLVHAGIDSYWFRSCVGALLILSVLANLWIKNRTASLSSTLASTPSGSTS